MNIDQIKFGQFYEDRVSGIQGVATAYAVYCTGCNQVLIQPRAKENEMPTDHWLDIERLREMDEAKPIDIPTSPSGGPRGNDAPPKR